MRRRREAICRRHSVWRCCCAPMRCATQVLHDCPNSSCACWYWSRMEGRAAYTLFSSVVDQPLGRGQPSTNGHDCFTVSHSSCDMGSPCVVCVCVCVCVCVSFENNFSISHSSFHIRNSKFCSVHNHTHTYKHTHTSRGTSNIRSRAICLPSL